MADTVNVGGIKAPKKPTLYILGGIGVVGAAFYYRQKQASSAANQAAAISQSGANTGIDPATGYAYGSAEDAAALANQNDYISPDDIADDASSVTGNVIGYDQNGDPVYASSGGTTPGTFTSNAQWAQYVEAYLVQTEGADATTVGNAIGKYISGQALTSDMVAVVQNAIAIGGAPPVAGTNGYPPNYNTSSSGTTTTTPPPTTSKAGPISNLTGKVSGTTASFSWNKDSSATQGYHYVLSELNGTVTKQGNTTATSLSVPGLHKGWTYNFAVQGLPGGAGDNIHVSVG